MSTAQWTDLATIKKAVDRVLGAPESSKIKPNGDDQEDAIRDALDELGKLRPEKRVNDEVGDGTKRRYILKNEITGWNDELSTLEIIEIIDDLGTNDETRRVIAAADYEIRLDSADDLVLLLLKGIVAGTGQTLRMTWTHPTEINGLDSATSTTVAERWKQVVLLLACERLAYLIARKASDQADNTLGIDQVEFRTFDRRWKERAIELRKRAVERLVPGEIGATAPGTSVEYRTESRLYGRRITH